MKEKIQNIVNATVSWGLNNGKAGIGLSPSQAIDQLSDLLHSALDEQKRKMISEVEDLDVLEIYGNGYVNGEKVLEILNKG